MAEGDREAKVHTSWTDPDAAYDDAVAALRARRSSADAAFVADLERFLVEHRSSSRAGVDSLAQTAAAS